MASESLPKIQIFPSFDSLPDPPIEEIVEPKSLRNRFITTLITLVTVPVCLLGFLLQQQFQEFTQSQDKTQIAITQNIVRHIDERVFRLEEAFRRHLDIDDLANTSVQSVFQAINAEFPDLKGMVYKSKTGVKAVASSSRETQRRVERRQEHLGTESSSIVCDISKEDSFATLRFPLEHGSVVALVNIERQYEKIRSLYDSDQFSAQIFDTKGRLVASLTKAVSLAQMSRFEVSHALNYPNGKVIRETEKPRNQALIKCFMPVRSCDWIVALSQPVSVRDLLLLSGMKTTGFMLLLSIVATLFIALRMAIPLSKSITTLSDAVEEFRRTGKHVPTANILEKEGTTELIRLAKSFDRMAHSVLESRLKLERMNTELESQVNERTQSLVSRNRDLEILKNLLIPIEGHSPDALDHFIEDTLNELKEILPVDRLEFVRTEEAIDGIAIEAAKKRFGYLIYANSTGISAETQKSLQRIAASLSIVLGNFSLVDQLDKERGTLVSVFRSITDGVIILGKSGRIRYANDVACRFLNGGKSLEGKDIGQQLRSEWTLQSGVLADRLADTQGTLRLVARDSCRSPSVLDMAKFTVWDLPEYPGKRTGFVFRDSTSQAKLEAMKDNIISVVAHELKTPLTLLLLQAETVRKALQAGREVSAAEVQELISGIESENAIIDDLLDVSRIEGGMLQISLQPTQIASVLDRAARLTKSRYPIRIDRKIDADAEVFPMGAARMTQVFVNLFNNAARYKKSQQMEALCHVTVDSEGDQVRIVVADEGNGIDAEKLPHVFDRFYQGDMTLARPMGGVGLGLSIVKGIIEAHGGTITVESQLGVGTTFRIVIPI